MKKIGIITLVAIVAIAAAAIVDYYTELADFWLFVIVAIPVILAYFYLQNDAAKELALQNQEAIDLLEARLSESIKNGLDRVKIGVDSIPDYRSHFQTLSSSFTNGMETASKASEQMAQKRDKSLANIISLIPALEKQLKDISEKTLKNNEAVKALETKLASDFTNGVSTLGSSMKGAIDTLSSTVAQKMKENATASEKRAEKRDTALNDIINNRIPALEQQLSQLKNSINEIPNYEEDIKDIARRTDDYFQAQKEILNKHSDMLNNLDALKQYMSEIPDRVTGAVNEMTDAGKKQMENFIGSCKEGIDSSREENERFYKEYSEKAQDTIKDIKRSLEGLVTDLKDSFGEFNDSVQELKSLQDTADDFNETVEDFKECVDGMKDSSKELDESEKETLNRLEDLLGISSDYKKKV